MQKLYSDTTNSNNFSIDFVSLEQAIKLLSESSEDNLSGDEYAQLNKSLDIIDTTPVKTKTNIQGLKSTILDCLISEGDSYTNQLRGKLIKLRNDCKESFSDYESIQNNFDYDEFGEDNTNSKVNNQIFTEDNVYSSWFGIQNQQDLDFLFGTYDRNGDVGIEWRGHSTTRKLNKMTRNIPGIGEALNNLNTNLRDTQNSINNYFASKGLRDYFAKNDESVIFGKNVELNNVQLLTKTLWANDISLYDNFDDPATLDLGFAEASGSAGVLYGRSYGRAAIGPDHAFVDAAVQVGVFNANGSVDVPVWTTESGQEIVSASVDGNVSVLEAYAKGRIGVGVYTDENGVTHTEAGLQANVGADVVKVSAGASVNVAGIEGKVSGTVKIGIGAQLDIGFADGKLRANIGLAAGIGFDVGLELDVSGFWNNLKSVFTG